MAVAVSLFTLTTYVLLNVSYVLLFNHIKPYFVCTLEDILLTKAGILSSLGLIGYSVSENEVE